VNENSFCIVPFNKKKVRFLGYFQVMLLISARPNLSSYSINWLYYSSGWDAGPTQATLPTATGTQLILGGEKQVGISVLHKDTEEQIVVNSTNQYCTKNDPD